MRRRESGMTVIEAMIGLAVAAVAVVPVLVIVAGLVRELPKRAERRAATDLAAAAMEELTHPRLVITPVAVATAQAELDGKRFVVETRSAAVQGTQLRRIEVSVRREGAEQAVVSLAGVR